MEAEMVLLMLGTGSVLAISVIIIIPCWEWYAGFWGRKLSNIERVLFTFTSLVLSIVAVGVLAWLATFVGIIMNAMYKIIL